MKEGKLHFPPNIMDLKYTSLYYSELYTHIYTGQIHIWLQKEADLFQELVCPQYFIPINLIKILLTPALPSLILGRIVCYSISPARLDTAERHFMGQDSVITIALHNKTRSGKRKCKH